MYVNYKYYVLLGICFFVIFWVFCVKLYVIFVLVKNVLGIGVLKYLKVIWGIEFICMFVVKCWWLLRDNFVERFGEYWVECY